jgi:hypothetical protein
VVKIQTSDMTIAGFWNKTSTASGANGILEQGVISPDGQYGYFAADNMLPTWTARVRLSDMTLDQIGSFGGYGGLILSPDGTKIYGTGPNSNVITEANASTFATIRTATTDIDPTQVSFNGGVGSKDGRFAYFTTDGGPSAVVKVNLGTMTQVGAKQTLTGTSVGWAIGLSPDGTTLITGNNAATTQVNTLSTSDMSVTGTRVMTPSEGRGFIFAMMSPDGLNAYFAAWWATPFPIVKFQYAENFGVTVTKAGAGSGTVSSDLTGIACGATCTAQFPSTSSVVLTATAASDSSFDGWSGACSGSGTCTVATSEARAVTATFSKKASDQSSPSTPTHKATQADAVTLPAGVVQNGLSATANGQVGITLVCPKVPGGCDADGTLSAILPSDLLARTNVAKILARFSGVHIAEGHSKLITVRLANAEYRALRARGITKVRAILYTRNRLSGGQAVIKRTHVWLHIAPLVPVAPVTG